MGSACLRENRKHTRFKPDDVSTLFPGEIFSVQSGNKVSYRIHDFSSDGIGIITYQRLLTEIDFILMTYPDEHGDIKKIHLSLAWGVIWDIRTGKYRYGFQATGGNSTLDDIFNIEKQSRKHLHCIAY